MVAQPCRTDGSISPRLFRWKIKKANNRIKDIAAMRNYQAYEEAQFCWENNEDIDECIEIFK